MTREEILEKSRQENKDMDMVEKESAAKAGNAAAIGAAVVAGVLYAVQIICGGGVNLALWAVVTSIQAVYYLVMFIRMRKGMHMMIAVLYTVLTLCLSAGHIVTVIENSPALFSEEQMGIITEMAEVQ